MRAVLVILGAVVLLAGCVSGSPDIPLLAQEASSDDVLPDVVAALDAAGVLKAEPVGRLLSKHERTGHLSEFEDMALVGVLSTQLMHEQFVHGWPRSVAAAESVRVRRGEERSS